MLTESNCGCSAHNNFFTSRSRQCLCKSSANQVDQLTLIAFVVIHLGQQEEINDPTISPTDRSRMRGCLVGKDSILAPQLFDFRWLEIGCNAASVLFIALAPFEQQQTTTSSHLFTILGELVCDARGAHLSSNLLTNILRWLDNKSLISKRHF